MALLKATYHGRSRKKSQSDTSKQRAYSLHFFQSPSEAWSLAPDRYDLGINTFDTANMYCNGLSEVILGKAIKQHKLPRDDIVVMTKVFFTVGHKYTDTSCPESAGYVNQRGLSRKVRLFWQIFDEPVYFIEYFTLAHIWSY